MMQLQKVPGELFHERCMVCVCVCVCVCVEHCWMHCLYVPSCAECAELTQENERNKLSIAELSQSKVWVCVHWRILCMYVCIHRWVWALLPQHVSLQIPPLTEERDAKKAQKWV